MCTVSTSQATQFPSLWIQQIYLLLHPCVGKPELFVDIYRYLNSTQDDYECLLWPCPSLHLQL